MVQHDGCQVPYRIEPWKRCSLRTACNPHSSVFASGSENKMMICHLLGSQEPDAIYRLCPLIAVCNFDA